MSDMTDLGYKYSNEVSPASDKKKHYPSVSFQKSIPESLMDYDIDDEVRLEIVAKITNKGADSDGKRVGMDILKAKCLGAAGKKNKEEYDSMSDEEKEKYDEESVGL